MDTKIISYEIDGIKSPRIFIQGLLCENEKLFIYVDGKETEYEDMNYIGHNVVFKNYVDFPEFRYNAALTKNAKLLEIVIKKGSKKETILTKKIDFFSRIKIRVHKKIENFKTLFISILKATKRVIKDYFKNNKFKISKQIINMYYKMWRYNIGKREIEKKYYILEKQRDYLNWINENEIIETPKKFKYNPLISILIPVYNAEPKYLKECLDSVLKQTYTNFEICIADDHSTRSETLDVLKEYSKKYKQIKIVYRKTNGHISKCTNSALELASGEYVGLLDNDDTLALNALYEVVKALNDDKKIDMLYSDEDKIALNGLRSFPNFKPDYSPDTLLSMNYICHFTVLRKAILEKLNGFRSEYDGAQDYDLFLRFVEQTDNEIHHISKILYHWRESKSSTALDTKNKNYGLNAGKLALEDALKRRKIKANVEIIEHIDRYKISYNIVKEPKISIIIPTKNSAEVLDKCLSSIYNKTDYKNYEIIVIDNNSDQESLFNLLDNYKTKYKNFSSYRYECEFNYSYLNNEGVKLSTGDFIVLLNNDTEVISSDWLKTMVGYASQKHIGCVGVELLYPSNNIQHVGVVVGMGGVASHTYVNVPSFENGYFNRLKVPYDVKMVTAACLMIKKSIFKEIKGLDEKLKIAYNDVDFNVRIRNKGYYNVILPQVKMYHYESYSRGSDLIGARKERFKTEIKYVVDKLSTSLVRDEFYNDNLSYDYWFVLNRRY